MSSSTTVTASTPAAPSLLAVSRFSTWSSVASQDAEQQDFEEDTCFTMDIDEERDVPSPALSDGGSSCFSQDTSMLDTPKNVTAAPPSEYFEKQFQHSPTLLPPTFRAARPNLKRFGQFFPSSPSLSPSSIPGQSGMNEDGAAHLLWAKLEALTVRAPPQPSFAFTPATPIPAPDNQGQALTPQHLEAVASDDSWTRALLFAAATNAEQPLPDGLKILLQQAQ